MSTLVLVRHGQAAFLEADYDRLSPLGEAQARALGRWWAARGQRVDEVWVGPRVRQQRTAELAAAAYVEAGGRWPEARALPELDEYHAELVLKRAALELARRDDGVRALAEAYASASERPAKGKAFEKLFQAVTRRWVAGEVHAEGAEPWPEFRARVARGLAALVADPPGGAAGRASGRTVAAFTSAGAIGVAIGLTLRLDDVQALELGWVVKNASLTEILFSGGRTTLSTFNGLPHLDDPAHHTYR